MKYIEFEYTSSDWRDFTIVAEGSTIQECMDDAYAFINGRDGDSRDWGSISEFGAREYDTIQRIIRAEFKKDTPLGRVLYCDKKRHKTDNKG